MDKAVRTRLSDFLFRCSPEELHDSFAEPWLNEIIPGIRELIGCNQGHKKHLEGDVAKHTCLVFDNLLKISRKRLGREADFIERLSVLIHDLAKPKARIVDEDQDVHFPKHETLAAARVPNISTRLDLSFEDRDRLLFVVMYHGDAHNFTKLRPETQKVLKTSPYNESLALVQEADAISCLLPDGSCLPSYWEELLA